MTHGEQLAFKLGKETVFQIQLQLQFFFAFMEGMAGICLDLADAPFEFWGPILGR